MLAVHKGTQGKSKPTESEAEVIELKLEGDPGRPEGNPREFKANRKGGRGDRNNT